MAKKVLIVDDKQDICSALKLLIEYEGYEVVIAMDGREALAQTLEHMPDLILMDLMDLAMPGLNGIEATLLIRSNPLTTHIPIICVSSYGDIYKGDVLAAGSNEVHTKTSFIEAFSGTLEKYLER